MEHLLYYTIISIVYHSIVLIVLEQFTFFMKSKLEKIKALPYYIQIKNILKERIQSGRVASNRLPPIRHMAKEFGVSINTVLRACDELAKEGIVSGSVGRGTFIATKSQKLDQENRNTILTRIIELSVEEALSHEFSLQEFEEAVKEYVKYKLEMMQNIVLVFIECNIEQLIYFTNHLELNPNIKRLPVLLEDVSQKKDDVLKEIQQSDIIVTSFYHLDEVHDRLDYLNKPVIGINLEPEVRTIVDIAKISSESTVGIITTSKTFIEIIKQILADLNLHFKEIVESNSKDEEVIKQVVSRCDTVLASPRRKKLVSAYSQADTKIIEFVFVPDRTSINNLKMAILELKKNFS